MSIEQSVVANLRELSIEKQLEVLDFVEFLALKSKHETTPFGDKSQRLLGKYAHLGIQVSADEIDEVRKEIWCNFPRDIEL